MFWDLYCAAPERRDTCEHSSEAKAFHDYVSTVRSLHVVRLGSGTNVFDEVMYIHLPLSCKLVKRF